MSLSWRLDWLTRCRSSASKLDTYAACSALWKFLCLRRKWRWRWRVTSPKSCCCCCCDVAVLLGSNILSWEEESCGVDCSMSLCFVRWCNNCWSDRPTWRRRRCVKIWLFKQHAMTSVAIWVAMAETDKTRNWIVWIAHKLGYSFIAVLLQTRIKEKIQNPFFCLFHLFLLFFINFHPRRLVGFVRFLEKRERERRRWKSRRECRPSWVCTR